MPTWPAMACRGAPVVAGHHDDLAGPALFSPAIASAAPSLTVSAMPMTPGDLCRRPRPAPPSCLRLCSRSTSAAAAPRLNALVAHQPGGADEHACARPRWPGCRARRSPRTPPGWLSARPRSFGRRARWPRPAGAPTRARPTRPAAAARLAGRSCRTRSDVRHRRLALRDRAGLVQHDRLQLLGPLQRLGAAEQDAVLRALARAHHDRGRRRQAQRARAGDDQHRHHVDHGRGEAGVAR